MTLPSFRLDGQVVLVTGASRGIGAECARGCAAAGAELVVLVGRSADELEAVAADVRAAGSQARVAPCDVTSIDEVRGVVADLDRIDALVNCAGTNRPGPFIDVEASAYDLLFDLNVRATFFVTQIVVAKMIAGGRPGAVINVSSQMGHVGASQRSIYCATKHAIEGLTKALAVELAPHGIRVLSIAPTFIRTAMTSAQLDDPDVGTTLLEQIPLGRFGTTEEVAAAVVFAASPAAGLVTGSSLMLDGGWTAR